MMYFNYLASIVTFGLATLPLANARALRARQRRKESLHFVSPNAAAADCNNNLEIQLFSDSPRLTFVPRTLSCKSGKRFSGAVDNTEMVHSITLVPGRGGNGSFAAVVKDDATGGIHMIGSDASGNMMVVERYQGDFPAVHLYGDRGTSSRNLLVEGDADNESSSAVALDRSHHRNRKLIQSIVPTSNSLTVTWTCRRNRKDTVCVKETSDSGSPCSNGPDNHTEHVPKGGSKWKTCVHEIKNLKCSMHYDVRVRQNWFEYIEWSPVKTDPCGTTKPDPSTIDIMVLWNSDAECFASDLATGCQKTAATTSKMEGDIDLAIEYANVAFYESDVFVELNHVHSQLIDYSPNLDDNISDINILNILYSLNDKYSQIGSKVDDLRSEHDADIVYTILDFKGWAGGAALSDASEKRPKRKNVISVGSWEADIDVFAHEVGHTLGCSHDRGTETAQHKKDRNFCTDYKQDKYNFGWRDPDAEFHSIMAYECKVDECDNIDPANGPCNRVQMFSNDSLKYNGNKSIGNHKNNNSRRINDMAKRVAGFYPRPKCMAGSIKFIHGSETKQLQDLQVGDNIRGLDGDKTVTDSCEVVSLTSKGTATVFEGYTSDHYILSGDNVVTNGDTGQEEQDVKVYQVLTSCPVVEDDTGKKSTFSICGESLHNHGPMSWSEYIKIHSVMFKLVKATGLHSIDSMYNIDDATEFLPILCSSGLKCVDSGECDEFEATIVEFVDEELVQDARDKVYATFPGLGTATSEDSISVLVSNGKSVDWQWYPDHVGGTSTCKRDGNHLPYMKNGWLKDTIESCCAQYFSWDLEVCMSGDDELGSTSKFFADPSGMCLKDCEPGPFGCARVPPPIVLYDSIETCCKVGLSWVDISYCYSRSIDTYSDGWVVNYQAGKCAMDCEASDGPPCVDSGDLVRPSETIYKTPEECCAAKLNWISPDLCALRSKNDKYYTEKFYADYIGLKCAKDCPAEDDLPCSGNPVNHMETLYDTAKDCCEHKLWWLNIDQCMAMSNGIDDQGSGEWYVDWEIDYGTCVKDCEGATPCGGIREQWEIGYPSSATCCEVIFWKDEDSCHL